MYTYTHTHRNSPTTKFHAGTRHTHTHIALPRTHTKYKRDPTYLFRTSVHLIQRHLRDNPYGNVIFALWHTHTHTHSCVCAHPASECAQTMCVSGPHRRIIWAICARARKAYVEMRRVRLPQLCSTYDIRHTTHIAHISIHVLESSGENPPVPNRACAHHGS